LLRDAQLGTRTTSGPLARVTLEDAIHAILRRSPK
jgi:hypothetical protein